MEQWLAENVWMGPSYMRREDVLWLFVMDYLIPFVEGKGYTFAVTDRTFFNRLVWGLYSNRSTSYISSDWSFGHVNTDYLPEERWEFDYTMSPEEWKHFWSHCPIWSDLEDETGKERQHMIEDYIWTQLNLDKSARTRVVYEHLGIDEEALEKEPGKGRHEETYGRDSGESYLRELGYRRRN